MVYSNNQSFKNLTDYIEIKKKKFLNSAEKIIVLLG